MHVTPAHGSPTHVPDEHPFVHVVLIEVYEHVPPLHVPGDAALVRVFASEHVAGGGWLHVIPAQGSPMHMPDAHPVVQVVIVAA